jgi:hypothetical protein
VAAATEEIAFDRIPYRGLGPFFMQGLITDTVSTGLQVFTCLGFPF